MFCLLKIAYDNTFHGFQVQPGFRTVQGEMLRALRPLGIDKIYVSSRTDSHVRSVATVVEMECHDVLKVCRIVDSIEGIIVLGYATSESFFKLRSGFVKTYWYISPCRTDQGALSSAIEQFLRGKMNNFSKDSEKNVILEGISYINDSSFTLLVFSGRAFSWSFVRIAGETIIRRALGEIEDGEWNEMLLGKRKSRYRGRAENLILVNSAGNIEFFQYHSRKIGKIREAILPELAWASLLDASVLKFMDRIGSLL